MKSNGRILIVDDEKVNCNVLVSLLDEYDIEAQCLHIKQGKPWHVINDFACELKAQCVVVGSLGRSGIPGKLLGNTSEKVVHQAQTDLLVLKLK